MSLHILDGSLIRFQLPRNAKSQSCRAFSWCWRSSVSWTRIHRTPFGLGTSEWNNDGTD